MFEKNAIFIFENRDFLKNYDNLEKLNKNYENLKNAIFIFENPYFRKSPLFPKII